MALIHIVSILDACYTATIHFCLGTRQHCRLSAAPPLPACGGLLPVTRHQEPVMPVGTTSSGRRPAAGRSHCQPPSRRSACVAGGGSRW